MLEFMHTEESPVAEGPPKSDKVAANVQNVRVGRNTCLASEIVSCCSQISRNEPYIFIHGSSRKLQLPYRRGCDLGLDNDTAGQIHAGEYGNERCILKCA